MPKKNDNSGNGGGVQDYVQEAGAPSEGATERDGFLSWKAETHALVAAAGVAFLVSTGTKAGLIGPVVTAVSAGLRGRASEQPSVILTDIKNEPHYALGGLLVGALFGMVYRVLSGMQPIPL